MKYWTLFTLRMMARAGLSLSVGLWVFVQLCPINDEVVFGDSYFIDIEFNSSYLLAAVHRHEVVVVILERLNSFFLPAEFMAHWNGLPIDFINVPGVWIQLASGQQVFVSLEHWLLCLTFLIATIVTSVRSRKTGTTRR